MKVQPSAPLCFCIIALMQARWSAHIMFYLLAFPEPTMLSVNQAYFWPTFTCIPNPRLRHVVVLDWAGTFWILRQHQVFTRLFTSCGSASLSSQGHTSLVVVRIQIEVSWTWCLWDTMYACIDGLRERPPRGVRSVFPSPSTVQYSTVSVLVACLPCTLNDIRIEAQLKNNLWGMIRLTGALTLRPANSHWLQCFVIWCFVMKPTWADTCFCTDRV